MIGILYNNTVVFFMGKLIMDMISSRLFLGKGCMRGLAPAGKKPQVGVIWHSKPKKLKAQNFSTSFVLIFVSYSGGAL